MPLLSLLPTYCTTVQVKKVGCHRTLDGASEQIPVEWLPSQPSYCGPQEAVSAIEALAGDCGVRLRKLDRRGERSLAAAHAQALRSQLARELDAAAALSLAVPLLLAQVCTFSPCADSLQMVSVWR